VIDDAAIAAIARQDVILAVGALGGTATATQLGERFGGWADGAWTSGRLYLRLREIVRELRATGDLVMVGEKRTARYVIAPCACGHPRAQHVFDSVNEAGECIHEDDGEFCRCSRFERAEAR
jgi:hypothetical protein